MPKVSIVIPIFGVEKDIERCARSLFEQTFDDVEYLFVNDCTRDASIEVLQSVIEDYPKRKPQIKIFHHSENLGLPQARKTGILAAAGDYIISFDSDDWVEHTIIETLYTKALLDKADIVICDIYKSNGTCHQLWKCGETGLGKMEFFEQMCMMKFTWSTCNKLFRRTLFKDILFPTRNNAEDMALTLQLMAKADKVAYVPQPLYYYYSNPQSMTRILTEDKVLKIIEDKQANNEIVFQVLKQILPSSKYLKYVEVFKWQVKKLAWNMLHVDKCHYGYWKSVHSDINRSMFFNRYITLGEKFKCVLTYLRMYPRRRE